MRRAPTTPMTVATAKAICHGAVTAFRRSALMYCRSVNEVVPSEAA